MPRRTQYCKWGDAHIYVRPRVFARRAEQEGTCGFDLGTSVRAMELRRDLQTRLIARLEEIRSAVVTRVYAVEDPRESGDPLYVDGLGTAVSAAIDYWLASVGASERNPPAIPPQLLVQARVAARGGIGLDTVLRRYFAGYVLLGEMLFEEAEGIEVTAAALKEFIGIQSARFDRLIAAISAEYAREAEARPPTGDQRRRELVENLLAGQRNDSAELAYDLTMSHVGLVGKGAAVADVIRELATALDRRLLLVCAEGDVAWAWLGGIRPVDREALRRAAARAMPANALLAVGEPAQGVDGWRLSHRQAKAALPVGVRRRDAVVEYRDVALLAAVASDELLSTSLRQIYLRPLETDRDDGRVARETLRAYFDSGRSISAAAASLGINRNTVTNRFRSIEDTLGRSLDECGTEVDVALHVEQLSFWSHPPAP